MSLMSVIEEGEETPKDKGKITKVNARATLNYKFDLNILYNSLSKLKYICIKISDFLILKQKEESLKIKIHENGNL